MLEPKLQSYLTQAYNKLGDIGYDIALKMKKGKDSTPAQRDLYEQGIKMRLLLIILFRHVTFDETTSLPTLWRITEEQVNKLLRCLIKIGELDKYPVVPLIYPTSKPRIIATGLQGNQGERGIDGSNANIIVQLKAGESQLKLTSTVSGLVKTYELSYQAYVIQLFSAAIQSGKLFEIGTSQNINILLTSTKGTENIQTITCTDSIINTQLQSLLNLTSANNILSQPYQITIPLTAQTVTTTYTFNNYDGKNTVTSSDVLTFCYPFFSGNSENSTLNPYTALNKLIAVKNNISITFNGTDDYFYFCYPQSYGNLTSIKDPNGFEAIGAFTLSTLSVASSGLTSNWTITYNIYRTTLKTTIVNGTYQFIF